MSASIDHLIPELAQWNNGQGIDVESWIGAIGRYDHAIGYSVVFWPRFFVHEDCVFRRPMNAASYHDWLAACRGDKRTIERVVNHLHIAELFHSTEFSPSRDVILFIGSTLRVMWSSKLQRDFPERVCTVEFRPEGVVDLIDYQITFFQESPGTPPASRA